VILGSQASTSFLLKYSTQVIDYFCLRFAYVGAEMSKVFEVNARSATVVFILVASVFVLAAIDL
jgi:hypothetical protein